MIVVRSLLFNVLFFAWSIVLHVVCIPLLGAPAPALFLAARVWVRVTLWLLARVCGLTYEVRGRENLPAEPCIIASKHQSAWDTLIFPLLVKRPCYVFKRELMWIPLFGWYVARAGGIAIDRAGGAAALRRMLRAAERALAAGGTIIIFPEGTRVAPGRRRPYHPGVAALYGHLGVPVVPVAVNSGLYWGRRSFYKKPGRIVLEFLPPIAPGLSRRGFLDELQQRIEPASDRLAACARVGTDTDTEAA
ncbi:MAG: 1-acyl-sn-glycerol-3-phosphate acyltransferase [Alphaproteobacteria bacterium]|nr:MAG: 1-acyl-sn-glycerol-3-phosphate acyltransferase [Alphaproteobacteria bacterium]